MSIQENGGNEIAGNYKENINANEAPTECTDSSVKQNYGNDRYGSQAVDIGTIFHQLFAICGNADGVRRGRV